MKRAFVYYLCLAMGLFSAYYLVTGIRENKSENITLAVIVIIITALIAWRMIKSYKKEEAEKLKRLKKEAQLKEIERKKEEEKKKLSRYQYFNFKVAGTTFKNDDGSKRQDILRHIKFRDPPYVKEDNQIVAELNETEFDGEVAFKVVINDYQIGFVPKASIPVVEEAFEHEEFSITAVDVTGGGRNEETGEKLSYGCTITARYLK